MAEERRGVERDIMTDEELIRKELENRKREIDIMTNFINMKNNASKWLEEAKLSINKDTLGETMEERELREIKRRREEKKRRREEEKKRRREEEKKRKGEKR